MAPACHAHSAHYSLFPVLRRIAALLAVALAVVAGVAAPAAAQAVPGLTATLSVATSTTVGVSVQATAVFTPPTTPAPLEVAIRLTGAGAGTNATLATASVTSELTSCGVRQAGTQVMSILCAWTPTAGSVSQTLAVTINAVAVSSFTVDATGGPTGGASNQVVLDSSPFAITQQAPPTTVATTAPTGPTTSSAVAPTSAAATTQPAALPPTGGSDANAFIALTVLALGAFLVIMARKFREA